jgi:cell shape-determining protein MreC
MPKQDSINKGREAIPDELWLLFIALILIGFNLFNISGDFIDVISTITSPITERSASAGQKTVDLFGTFTEISELKKENQKLQVENAKVTADNEAITLILEENRSLKKELELGSKQVDKVEASVLGSELSIQDKLLINVGKESGLKRGDIAVIGNIFIGRIGEVSMTSAEVILLNNELSSYEVIISPNVDKDVDTGTISDFISEKENHRAVLSGLGSGSEIENISKSADISDGDPVFINDPKVNDIYYAGDIVEIDSNPSATTKSAKLVYPLNYSSLNYLFIIKL